MLKLINKRFGITMEYNVDKKDIIGKVHFWANNQVEIEAFVMDDVKEYQEDIKEETQILSNAKTKEDIINYLTDYAGWEIVDNFKEKDFKYGYLANEDTYLLDFVEFKIAVRK